MENEKIQSRDPACRRRIQFDLTDKMRDLLDHLVLETGATNRGEVLRRAMSVFALLVEETNKGHRVEVVNQKDSERKVLIVK